MKRGFDMKKTIAKIIAAILLLVLTLFCFTGCNFFNVIDNILYKLDSVNDIYMFENIAEFV